MFGLRLIRIGFALCGRLAPGLAARIARHLLMTPRPHPAPDHEKAIMAQARRLPLPNGLSALQWGSSGPTVLCVHGWEGRASQFVAFVEPLLAAGYRVVSLDAPAHGLSPGKQAHPLSFAQAILDAGQALGPLALVIGHSMGAGATAIALGRGLDTQRVVYIAGPDSFRHVLLRFARFINLPPRATRRFLARVESHTRTPLKNADIRKLADHFEQPALIVHDRNDRIVPHAEGATLARLWPQSRLLSTTGLGHHRVLKDASVVAAALDFIGSAQGLTRAA